MELTLFQKSIWIMNQKAINIDLSIVEKLERAIGNWVLFELQNLQFKRFGRKILFEFKSELIVLNKNKLSNTMPIGYLFNIRVKLHLFLVTWFL